MREKAVKTHPYEQYVGLALDQIDQVGLEGLTERQFQAVGFHWLRATLNGRRSKKELLALFIPATGMLAAVSGGAAFGIAKAVGG